MMIRHLRLARDAVVPLRLFFMPSSISTPPAEAEKLFNTIWNAYLRGFNQVSTFRTVASYGLAAATEAVTRDARAMVQEMFISDEWKDIFYDRDAAIAALGPVDKLALPMAARQIATFQAAVDAASIVFCHSLLDAAAFDFCRVTALADPSTWEDIIGKKQVSLTDMKFGDYATALQRKLEEHLEQFERESLIRKIDRLFAICKPASDFAPVKGFAFDRPRIERLDKLRHDIIHGGGVAPGVTFSDADVFYFLSVANFLLVMLNRRFGLKLDPNAMLAQAVQAS